jgi:hypothetical protein
MLVKDDLVHGLSEIVINFLKQVTELLGLELRCVLRQRLQTMLLLLVSLIQIDLRHVVDVVVVSDLAVGIDPLLMSFGDPLGELNGIFGLEQNVDPRDLKELWIMLLILPVGDESLLLGVKALDVEVSPVEPEVLLVLIETLTGDDPKEERFIAYWQNEEHDPKLFKISRINILFEAEDPVKFAQRVAEAHQERIYADSKIRYNYYIDNMPKIDLNETDQEQKHRLQALT